MTNLLEWILYSTTMLYIIPFLTGHEVHWQWEAGAAAEFLAWFNCLLFLRRYHHLHVDIVAFFSMETLDVQVIKYSNTSLQVLIITKNAL